MATNARVGKTYPIIGQVTVSPIKLSSQDISSWRTAVNSARNIHFPRRRQLLELYENILLDGKLSTVDTKRRSGITNKQFRFYKKGSDGEVIPQVQDNIIDTIFFDKLLKALHTKNSHGHALIELVPGGSGIADVNLIPHANVVPEKGELLMSYMDSTGIPYKGPNADPTLAKLLIEFGESREYGYLMSAAQYVIYKRGGFGDWAQFAELFGQPFRVGTYDGHDESQRLKLLTALKDMGGAGFTVIPDGTNIKFENANYGSGQSGIFKDLIAMSNDEIAQIVLGNTMTTDNGSSHDQAKIHKQGEEEITKSDLKEILNWLNGPFKQRLIQFGYKGVTEGMFDLEANDNISLLERAQIDDIVGRNIEIDPEYWYKRYKVGVPKGGPMPKQKEAAPALDTQKKKSLLSLSISGYYRSCGCSICGGFKLSAGAQNISLASNKEAERIAKLIFAGKLKPGSLDKKQIKKTADYLLAGIKKAWLRPESGFTQKDEDLLAFMRENVFVFSGFKNEKYLREASKLLLGADGNPLPFSEFKDKIVALDSTYNLQYLSAEYDHAIASSQMASKWLTFQDLQPDFPNLIYNTAGDQRVRPTHEALNGVVQPIDSPFWDTNYPPNGWGCRCDADATDQEATTPPSGPGRKQNSQDMFAGNVGKDGVIFPPNHPYFEASAAQTKKVTNVARSLM